MKTVPIRSMPLPHRGRPRPAGRSPGFQGKPPGVDQRGSTTCRPRPTKAMADLSTGRSSNLHEAMIAIQKAEISFKMMMQVRNKIISAYQEVMRMSV